MTICIWQLFGRGVFNLDLFFVYKFLRRSASAYFGRRVFNWDLFFSYKFLWRSASGYSFEEDFSSRIAPFPHKFVWRSASGYSFEEDFSSRIAPFPHKFLWRSASGNSLEEEFPIRIAPFPTNSYDDLHRATLWRRSFQLGSLLFLQIPMTICIWQLFERGVFN